MNIYCTYLTIYCGNKLPPFYIGSTSIIKVDSGYHGSVKSKKYKDIWESELVENAKLFKTIILTKHHERKDATKRECLFQNSLKVVTSPMYINQAIAQKNFTTGLNQSEEQIAKKSRYYCLKSPDDIIYTGTNIRKFTRENNLHNSAICDVNRGLIKQHNGWTSGDKTIQQHIINEQLNNGKLRSVKLGIRNKQISKEFRLISPEGKEYTGKNIKQFCLENLLNSGHIYQVLLGKKKHYKGWYST